MFNRYSIAVMIGMAVAAVSSLRADPPVPLPDAVVEAWTTAGGTSGALVPVTPDGIVLSFKENDPDDGQVPSFSFKAPPAAGFAALAEPTQDFGLDLDGFSDAGMKDLVRFHHLVALSIAGDPITDDGFSVVSQMPGLTSLSVNKTKLTKKSVDVIAGLKNLHALAMFGDTALGGGLAPLAQLKHLQALNVDETATDADMAAIGKLDELASLKVGSSPITDEGVKSLAGLKKLTFLDLSEAGATTKPLSDACCPALGQVTNLEKLDLQGAQITGTGAASLVTLKKLKYLSLYSTKVDDSGLKSLAGLPVLEELWLDEAPVTDAGMNTIATFPAIKKLHLDGENLTDETLKALGKCKTLTDLNISNAKITDAGLLNLSGLKELKSLNMTSCDKITDNGVAALQKLMPDTEIEK